MTEQAILAGGCFWGMEDLFRKHPGVTDTEVGYTGGAKPSPVYEDLKGGKSGHAESLRITFDTGHISYAKLLAFFFQIHDPTTEDCQGNDRGSQYRSAIFYRDEAQKQTAETVIAAVNASGKWPGRVVTQLAPAMPFYTAEKEHQDYLQRYPDGYTCHFIRPKWKLDDEALAS